MSFRKIVNGSAVDKGISSSSDISAIVDAAIADVRGAGFEYISGGTLDTITELSYSLNGDPSFASTVANSLSALSFPSIELSGDYILAKGKYFVNTQVPRTMTLPPNPEIGTEIQIFDATGTAGTNNITVLNNSNKINGVTDSAILDANGVAAVFVWTGSTYGWRMG